MLKKAQNRMANVRSTTDAEEKFNLPSPVMQIDKKLVKSYYQKLNDYMESVELYDPVFTDNKTGSFGIPNDKNQRYNWFIKLRLSYR